MRSLEAEPGSPRKYLKRISLQSRHLAFAHFFALAAICAISGCAAPGNPTPPHTGIPRAVGDLAAHQEGAAVVLTFTLPTKSVGGDTLDSTPDIDLYRASAPAPGGKPQFTLAATIPAGAVENYTRAGKIQISDNLDSSTVARGANLVYSIRTRTSKKRASADSNLAAVQLLLATQPPTDLRANVTEPAVILTWSAPAEDISGAELAAGSNLSYHIYRAELEASSASPQEMSQAKFKVPPALIGSATSPEFRDEHFTFAANYVYMVRAVANRASEQSPQTQSVESADSAPLLLTPKDIFPPAAPTGVVAAMVPATNQQPAYVELSWEANGEPDLAGYWVYRSEDSDTQGTRINSELLLSPVFRDTNSSAGKHYFYRVTAVDQAGNESPPSAAIAVDVPQQ